MIAQKYREIIMKLNDNELVQLIKYANIGKKTKENHSSDIALGSAIQMTSSASERYKVIKLKIDREERISPEDLGWFNKIDYLKTITSKKLPDELDNKCEKEVFNYVYEKLLNSNVSNTIALLLSPYLTNFIISGEMKKPLMFVGNPGCGKTELAKIIAKILGRPLYRTCPTQTDRNHGLRGEGSSFQSPDMGEILRADYETGYDNSVILFDEVSTGVKSDRQVNFEDEFLTILDDESMAVTDNYLSIRKSLKGSLLIFTDNDLDGISVRFQDRCVVCRISDVELDRMTRIIEEYIGAEIDKLTVSVEYSKDELIDHVNKLYHHNFHSIRRIKDMVDLAINSARTRYNLSDAISVTVTHGDFEEATTRVIANGSKETRKMGF